MRVATSFIIIIISTSADHCKSSNHKNLGLVRKKSMKSFWSQLLELKSDRNWENLILKSDDLQENPTNRILVSHRVWRLVWTDHLCLWSRLDRPTYPIRKGLLSDLANGPSGRGRGVLKKAGTGQRHGPTWSVANVRTDMVRNSEHWQNVSYAHFHQPWKKYVIIDFKVRLSESIDQGQPT